MVDRKYEYGDPVEDAASREFGCSGGETLPDEVFSERYEEIENDEDRNLTAIFDQILADDDDPVI